MVQHKKLQRVIGGVKFKYNPCYGSAKAVASPYAITLQFKYNPCYGSAYRAYNVFLIVMQFKYNPCYGSAGNNGIL